MKDLMWIIYLVNGKKILMKDSDYRKILNKYPKKYHPENKDWFSIDAKIEIDGVELEAAVREDCDRCIPSSQQKDNLLKN